LQLFATFSIFACNFLQLFRFLHATFAIFACKISCFKSFTVKCAHKCNLQRINATFAENKCNFLALLLQQKLALMLTIQQKAQCVLWYHEFKSPTSVQRKFRSEFGEDRPHTNSIKRWFKKFMETGRTLGAKLSIALTY